MSTSPAVLIDSISAGTSSCRLCQPVLASLASSATTYQQPGAAHQSHEVVALCDSDGFLDRCRGTPTAEQWPLCLFRHCLFNAEVITQ